jgi:hypothetical protein
VRRYDGPGNTADRPYALAIDKAGNVYVTGESGEGSANSSDFITVKYSPSGTLRWVARYDNLYDYATAIAVDTSGNVYVTGHSVRLGTAYDYTTVKYDSSGIEQWVRRHNGILNSDDLPLAIAVDDSGNVYVTGEEGGIGFTDYATVKYNSNGVLQWKAGYNGPGNAVDRAFAIAVDKTGNVYVTGESRNQDSDDDFATIKYNSFGEEQWVIRYEGMNSSYDGAKALALDSAGNVYVTGESSFTGGRLYTTVKYSQLPVFVQDDPIEINSITVLNYPNPFREHTAFIFTIQYPSSVTLIIVDMLGNEVAMPVSEYLNKGNHRVIWNPDGLTRGVYFYRLSIANEIYSRTATGKVINMKTLQH